MDSYGFLKQVVHIPSTGFWKVRMNTEGKWGESGSSFIKKERISTATIPIQTRQRLSGTLTRVNDKLRCNPTTKTETYCCTVASAGYIMVQQHGSWMTNSKGFVSERGWWYGEAVFLRNVGNNVQVHTVLDPRRVTSKFKKRGGVGLYLLKFADI
jgi:hypothetical protein